MSFLYFLEGLRCPPLDLLFSILTLLGEETVFMAVGMIVFWCVNKYDGYYLLCTGFVGTLLNQFLKILCRVPRPWVKDPSFTIVESAREAASGYSFPSGHTQTSVGLFGGLARARRELWLRIACIALCVLVPLSRMYLGVHTPADVLTSVCIALVMIFVFYPLFRKAERSPMVMYILLLCLSVAVIVYLCFVNLYPFPAEVYLETNVHNLESAQKNAYTLLGCMMGFLVVYTVDQRWLHFETKAIWWAQLLKVGGGLLAVMAAKELLRWPLDTLLGGHMAARSIRYFLMVLVAGILWPLTFSRFSKLGDKNNSEV